MKKELSEEEKAANQLKLDAVAKLKAEKTAEVKAKADSKKKTDAIAKTAADATKSNPDDIPLFPSTGSVKATKTEKFDKESKDLFKEYPDNKAFHFTSDGLAFFQHNDARNHATTLEDKEVISKVK